MFTVFTLARDDGNTANESDRAEAATATRPAGAGAPAVKPPGAVAATMRRPTVPGGPTQ